MRTLMRYFNYIDASLDRMLLEDYEVFCALFDEYSNTSNYGLNIAIPVRLMVADNQLGRAARMLAHAEASSVPNDDNAAANESAPVRVLDEEMFGEDQQPD